MGVKSEVKLNCKMSKQKEKLIKNLAENNGVAISYLLREGAILLGLKLRNSRNLLIKNID